MKATQYFSDDYLEQCKQMTEENIIQFLDDFRLIHSPKSDSKSKMISIKIEPSLLKAFKTKSTLTGMPYQTRIKQLMRQWLIETD